MSDLGNSMDMPFEPNPDLVDMPDEHVHYSGGVVVMAAITPVPGAGPKPSLVFRFATPTGDFYPPFVLVCDDDQMAKLRPLINEAVHAAREGARAAADRP